MLYHYTLIIHILCATIWTGGHLVLALVILPKTLRTRDVEELHAFESKYERIGIPALILLVVTGIHLAHIRVPDFSRWLSFDDPFTKLVGYKLLLLATTVVLAVDARLRIIPRLTKDNLNQLAWHIIPVTLVAVAFVLVGVGFRFGKVF
jgi:putative copper export protein